MDMKYAPDITRLNQGCKIVSILLAFKRQLTRTEIEALWWFQTPEERALAIEFVENLDVSKRTELVSSEPIMEWETTYTLNSPDGIMKGKQAFMDKVIPYVKETVDVRSQANMG